MVIRTSLVAGGVMWHPVLSTEWAFSGQRPVWRGFFLCCSETGSEAPHHPPPCTVQREAWESTSGLPSTVPMWLGLVTPSAKRWPWPFSVLHSAGTFQETLERGRHWRPAQGKDLLSQAGPRVGWGVTPECGLQGVPQPEHPKPGRLPVVRPSWSPQRQRLLQELLL